MLNHYKKSKNEVSLQLSVFCKYCWILLFSSLFNKWNKSEGVWVCFCVWFWLFMPDPHVHFFVAKQKVDKNYE